MRCGTNPFAFALSIKLINRSTTRSPFSLFDGSYTVTLYVVASLLYYILALLNFREVLFYYGFCLFLTLLIDAFIDGIYCEKCHYYSLTRGRVLECATCKHQHYLFASTIFQDNKLELYKLIMALYLFFSANKGGSRDG